MGLILHGIIIFVQRNPEPASYKKLTCGLCVIFQWHSSAFLSFCIQIPIGTFYNIPKQSEVVCISTLSSFCHMARQHSNRGSSQATDKTTVQSRVQYMSTHSCPQYWARAHRPGSPKNNID